LTSLKKRREFRGAPSYLSATEIFLMAMRVSSSWTGDGVRAIANFLLKSSAAEITQPKQDFSVFFLSFVVNFVSISQQHEH
jgi:hypothetical protein